MKRMRTHEVVSHSSTTPTGPSLARKALSVVLSVTLVVGLAPSLALATELPDASAETGVPQEQQDGTQIPQGGQALAPDEVAGADTEADPAEGPTEGDAPEGVPETSDEQAASDAATEADAPEAHAAEDATTEDAAALAGEDATALAAEDEDASLQADTSGDWYGFTWTVAGPDWNKTLTIEGSGGMSYAPSWGYPWADYNHGELVPHITKIVLKDKGGDFTAISSGAFSNFGSLREVIFPEHLQSIGRNAFYDCKELGTIALPNTVTSIEDAAFCGCVKLKLSTGLPTELTSIKSMCFLDCNALELDQLSDKITVIGDRAFSNCWNVRFSALPQYVTSIGWQAFMGCRHVAISTFPETLSSVGEEAFRGCTDITSFTFPAELTEMGTRAFADCAGLVNGTVKFLGSVPGDGVNVFEGVAGVKAQYPLRLESSWTAERRASFGGATATWVGFADGTCGESMRWEIPAGTISLIITGSGKMYDFAIGQAPWYPYRESVRDVQFREDGAAITSVGAGAFKGCTDLETVTLRSGLVSIGNSAFEGCTSLARITLPDTVKSIGDYAFSGCMGLSTLKLPIELESIGMFAFANCGNLNWETETAEGITLGTDVKSIGQKAFLNCSSLRRISFLGAPPASLGEGIFEGMGPCTVRLAAACADQWTDSIKARCKGTDITWEVAGDAKCGDSMTWAYSNGTLTITGSGQMYDYTYGSPWLNYARSIKKIEFVEEGGQIESIGEGAFYGGFSQVTELTLPANLKRLGAKCLYGMVSLNTIEIPASVNSVADSFLGTGNRLSYVRFMGAAPSIVSTAGAKPLDGLTNTLINYPLEQADSWDATLYSETFGGKNLQWRPYAEGTCGLSMRWRLDGLTLEIIGSGAMYDFEQEASPWYVARDHIAAVRFSEEGGRITSVGKAAFYQCSHIGSISLPSSITSIGVDAFNGCSSLELRELPASLTAIGRNAFNGCSSLCFSSLPSKVTSIKSGAFDGCSQLALTSLPQGLEFIEGNTFNGCTALALSSLPEGITAIDSSAFNGCTSLRLTELPSTLERIGGSAFADCSALAITSIPSSVTSIGNMAFAQCTSLASIDIPSSVESLGMEAFLGCMSLKSVTFRGAPSTMGDRIFSGMIGATVRYPASKNSFFTPERQAACDGVNLSWSSYADGTCGGKLQWGFLDGVLTITGSGSMDDFAQADGQPWKDIREQIVEVRFVERGGRIDAIGSYAFSGCTQLVTIGLPPNLKRIGAYAFEGCSLMELSALPPRLASIGDSAFDGCVKLTVTELPSALSYIGARAFKDCTGLTAVNVPATVQTMHSEAFLNCASLKKVVFAGDPPATRGIGMFNGMTDAQAHILRGDPPTWTDAVRDSFGGTNTQWVYSSGGMCGPHLKWSFIDGTLSITGYGEMSFEQAPWGDLSTQISAVRFTEIGGSITSIENNAFNSCANLAVCALPSGLTSIGDYAFFGCAQLGSIVIPKGVSSIGSAAFANCTRLTIDALPERLTAISDSAFLGCSTLELAALPPRIASIGPRAFDGCTSLALEALPESVTTIGDYAFIGCTALALTKLPDGLTSLGNSAFNGCEHLALTALPAGITAIAPRAFYDCTGLQLVQLPANVQNIGDEAFANCSNLLIGGMPANLVAVGTRAFIGCAKLGPVSFSSKLSSIGDEAFLGCTATASVEIASTLDYLGTHAFERCSLAAVDFVAGPPKAMGDQPFVDSNARATYASSFASAWTLDVRARVGSSLRWTERMTGTCGPSMMWTFEGSTLTISGSGRMNDYSLSKRAPWYPLRAKIETVLFDNASSGAIENVGASAFEGLSALTAVQGLDSASTIGAFAFSKCANLKTFNVSTSGEGEFKLPDSLMSIGNSAFSGCTMLGLTTLPAGLLDIGSSAFANCSALTCGGDLPQGLRTLGKSAFFGCTFVAFESIPEGITEIPDSAFSGCARVRFASIPDSVTRIGRSAFAGCESMPLASLPQGLTTIEDHAFFQCGELVVAELPAGVKTVRASAFAECPKLALAILPAGITSIGASAFYGCSAITLRELPTQLTTIPTKAFFNCSSITLASLPEGITSIGDEAFKGCSAITLHELPQGVKIIGAGAFNGCESIRLGALPQAVTSIGSYAFADCPRITLTSLPKGLTTICEGAFQRCTRLALEELPYQVGSIGAYAFQNCPNLSLAYLPDRVKTIGAFAFAGCSKIDLEGLPYGLTTIEEQTFAGCRSLSFTELPSGVKTIGSRAFMGCSGLSYLALPPELESVGDGAFQECTGLDTMVFRGKVFPTVTTVPVAPFEGMNGTQVAYPMGMDDQWTDAYRRSFGGTDITWTLTGTGTCGDNLTWEYLLGELFIVGHGDMYNYDRADRPWEQFTGEIESVTFIEEGGAITSVGNRAFSECPELSSVVLPKGLKTIGIRAFYRHSKLDIAELPDTVENIGSGAFCGQNDVNNVLALTKLPANLKKIGAYAFGYCTHVAVTELPGGLQTIADFAFVDTGITSLVIPASVTFIGAYAFKASAAVRSEKLTIVFQGEPPAGAHPLLDEQRNVRTYITVPRELEGKWTPGVEGTIDGSALDPNVKPAQWSTFAMKCGDNLTCIYDEDAGTLTITGHGEMYDFGVTQENEAPWKGVAGGIKHVVFEERGGSITSIGAYAFDGCGELGEISLPKELRSIGEHAFTNCGKIGMVELPDTLERIGGFAFGGCTALKSVVIPKSVTQLGNSVFSGDTALQLVAFFGAPPAFTHGEVGPFTGLDGIAATYPRSLQDVWTEDVRTYFRGDNITWQAFDDKLRIEGAEVTVPEVTFTGAALTPAPVVTFGGEALAEGTDYTVTYGQNINVAQGGTLELTGIGDYAGTKQVAFPIAPKPLAADMATLQGDSFTYTGESQGPQVTVADGSPSILKASDYELSGARATDAGVHTVTLTAKAGGNYAGSVEAGTYTIAPREITLTSASASKNYDGTALRASGVEVSGDGWAPGEGATFEVTGSQTEVGESANTFAYTLNAGVKPGNYAITQKTGTLTVNHGEITAQNIRLSASSFEYNAEEQGPSVVVTNGGVLQENVDYVVKDARATDVGSYELTVSGMGNYRGEACVSWTIDPAPLFVVVCEAKVYDGTVFTHELTADDVIGLVGGETLTGSLATTSAIADSYELTEEVPAGEQIEMNLAWGNGGKAENYQLTALAVLEIERASIAVKIEGACETAVYDGDVHEAEGFSIANVSGDVEAFDKERVVFVGDGEPVVERLDAGVSMMQLEAVDFDYDDACVDCTFEVTDGSITIQKAPLLISALSYKVVDGDPLSLDLNSEDVEIRGLADGDTLAGTLTSRGADEGIYQASMLADVPIGEQVEAELRFGPEEETENYNVFYEVDLVIDDPEAHKLYIGVVGNSATTSCVYDGQEHSVSGFTAVKIGGDYAFDPTKVSLKEGRTAEAHGTNAGTYRMGLTADDFEYNASIDGNYEIVYVDGCLVIDRKPLDTSMATLSETSFTYDGTSHGPSVTVADGSPSIIAETDYEIAGAAAIDAGEYTVTVSAKEGGNYAGSIDAGTFRIARRAVTLKSASASKTYDGTALTASDVAVSGDGWAQGEGASYSVIGSQTDAGTSENAFSYTLNEGTKAENYAVSLTSGTLEVKRAAATVTADDASKEYGEEDPALTASTTGVLAGEALDVSVTREQGEGVGTYAIVPAGERIQGNYTVAYVPGTFTIEQATEGLELECEDYSGAYDAQLHGSPAIPSVVEQTTVSYSTDEGATWSTTCPTLVNVGRVDVRVKAENPNFVTVEDGYSIEIAPAQATVAADDDVKLVDTDDPVLTATVTGTFGDDTLAYTLSRDAGEAVGTYAITPTGAAEQGNYAVAYEQGEFLIVPSDDLVVYGESYSGVYDGKAHGRSALVSIEEGTTVSYSLDDGKTWAEEFPTITDVGTLSVIVQAENPNYMTASAEYRLEVTPKSATVTAKNASKTFGNSDPEFKATVKGLLGTDTLTYAMKRKAGENAGTYTITPTGKATQGNYKVTYKTGTFTVKPRSVSGAKVAQIADITYTGKARTPSPTVKLKGVTLKKGTDYTLSYKNNVKVGTATVTITGKGNYTGAKTVEFKIVNRSWANVTAKSGASVSTSTASTGFPLGAKSAILVRDDDFPDSLAASSLAGTLSCPIVMTSSSALSSDAKAELKRLSCKTVYIIGGVNAVSEHVAKSVKSLGCKVVRIQGASRTDTAVQVAKKARALGSKSTVCFIAKGWQYADALSVGSYTYASGAPIFLAESDGTLSKGTRAAIKAGGYKSVVVLGGTASGGVSTSAVKELGLTWQRLAGDTRYETSAEIADWCAGKTSAKVEPSVTLGYENTCVARGDAFADALSAVNIAGPGKSVLLLVDPGSTAPAKEAAIAKVIKPNISKLKKGYIIGGAKAVGKKTASYLNSIL